MLPCAVSALHLGTRKASTLARNALYIDRGLLVVNKPPGITCQYNRQESAKEGEHSRFTDFINDLKEEFELLRDPMPVHRLDKDTTGALALAIDHTHARELARQFANRTVEKTYLALVYGGSKSLARRSGRIESVIQYSKGRAIVTDNSGEGGELGKSARTDYELLATSPRMSLSLMSLKPHTGLKHQLRIHMAHNLKMPIVGDTVYSTPKADKTNPGAATISNGRMFLHASSLTVFRYRREGKPKRARVTVCAPLPDYFVRVCQQAELSLPQALITGGLWVDDVRTEIGDRQADAGEESEEANQGRTPLQSLGARWFGS
ncbi:hypothetical protein CERSUDRAFT_118504 [Gelatoporia subvermispora B]|uniref:21S rRNA pseudouridine(2819) synthase n=1 Tax=Ceriporiopsis subvermispora (strain B) TaxID=914234 RepID=M2QKY0_CERS8|nr:hypothetical protein CERSUDRAFT_118504 [Gelatoporia subvermispora B]